MSVARKQLKTVESQKKFDCDKRRPFVAVYKGMVARQTKPVCRSQIGGIRFAIVRQLLWPGQGRLQHIGVPNPRATAMLCQALAVQQQ